MPDHGDLAIGVEIHPFIRWQHASIGEMNAQDVDDIDVGKVSWRTDTNSFFVLTTSAPTWTGIAGSASDLINDLTPQLGGDLDVNGFDIISASGGNILITPDSTGDLVLDGLNWPQADGTNGQSLITDGSGQLSWTTITSGIADVVDDTTPQLGGNLDVNGKSIVTVSNGSITLDPNGTGIIYLSSDNMQLFDSNTSSLTATAPIGGGDNKDLTLTVSSGSIILDADNGPQSKIILNSKYEIKLQQETSDRYVVGSSGSHAFTCGANQGVTIKLGDASGTNEFGLYDSGDNLKASIDSDGNAGFTGTLGVTGISTLGASLTGGAGIDLDLNAVTGQVVDLTINNASVFEVSATEIQAKQSFQYSENAYQDAMYDNGNSGAAITIDPVNGNYQKLTLTDDVAITLTSPSGPCTMHIHCTQDGTGGWVPTWVTSIYTVGGTAPVFSTDISAEDLLVLEFDGTKWIASLGAGIAVVA